MNPCYPWVRARARFGLLSAAPFEHQVFGLRRSGLTSEVRSNGGLTWLKWPLTPRKATPPRKRATSSPGPIQPPGSRRMKPANPGIGVPSRGQVSAGCGSLADTAQAKIGDADAEGLADRPDTGVSACAGVGGFGETGGGSDEGCGECCVPGVEPGRADAGAVGVGVRVPLELGVGDGEGVGPGGGLGGEMAVDPQYCVVAPRSKTPTQTVCGPTAW